MNISILKFFSLLLIFVFLFESTALAATDVKNDAALSAGLKSYYELEENSGDRTDSHGVYDLTDVNTVGSAAGIQGTSTEHVAASIEYLESGTGFGTNLGSSVTDFCISFWMWPDITSDNDGVVYIGSLANSHGEFYIALVGNQLYVRMDNLAFNQNFAFSDTSGWSHVVVSYDGASTTTWVNNVKKINAAAFSNTLNFTGLKMVIGRYYGSGGSSWGFDGNIDEVLIKTGSNCSGEDVAALYASGMAIPYDAGGGGGGAAPTPRPDFLLISCLMPFLNRRNMFI